MKKSLSLLLLISTLLLSVIWLYAQNKNAKKMIDPDIHFRKDWLDIDSLLENGQLQSANKKLKVIIGGSVTKLDWEQHFKAKWWSYMIEQQLTEDEFFAIKQYEREIKLNPYPLVKALWQNIAAKAYQDYLENNRYVLYQRTKVSNENIETQPEFWDALGFHDTIQKLYFSSLRDLQSLQNFKINESKYLINKGENASQFRNSLYELLAFNALNYFTSTESTITDPSYHFTFNDPRFFSVGKDFVSQGFTELTGHPLHLASIRTFQNIINLQLTNNITEALIDAEMLKLQYVHQNYAPLHKDSLYTQSLEKLSSLYPKAKSTAQIKFLIAQLKYNSLQIKDDAKKPTSNVEIQKSVTELKNIIAEYPGSIGATNARNLLQEIEKTRLLVQVEEAYMPTENLKIFLAYKNADQVKISVFKTTLLYSHNVDIHGPLIFEKVIDLPKSKSFVEESIEFMIPQQAKGQYILAIKEVNSGIELNTFLQVSDLTVMKQFINKQLHFRALHRLDGRPEPEAQIGEIFSPISEKKNDKATLGKTWKSNNDGLVKPSNKESYNYLKQYFVSHANDSFLFNKNENYEFVDYQAYESDAQNEINKQVFLFTDRSLYRPGQLIHIKGIMLLSGANNDNSVAKDAKLDLKFYDANYQLIKTIPVLTNEFGSFYTTLQAPNAGLLGSMNLQTDYGSTSIQVEEYKRPKFKVSLDCLNKTYHLNEKIVVTGKSLSYSGVPLRQAMVKYRVERTVRYPYFGFYSRPMPSGAPLAIKEGNTTTDAEGKFVIDFQALADASVDPNTKPVFHFTVYTDVSDLNGETHSTEQQYNFGYHGLNIDWTIPEKVIADGFDSIIISTKDLNENPVMTKGRITIDRLVERTSFKRNRLWESPTQHLYDEKTFNSYFPLDDYDDRWKLENRKVQESIWNAEIEVKEKTSVLVPKHLLKQTGYYQISFKTKDDRNTELEQKAIIFVVHPKNLQQQESALSLVTDRNSYREDDWVNLYTLSSVDKPFVFREFNIEANVSNEFNNNHQIQLKENSKGLFETQWAFMYQNRFYQELLSAPVPYRNKELNIKWNVLKDKFKNGETLEWTLTVTADAPLTNQAEILASMYDASLDAIMPHHWYWNKAYSAKQTLTNWRTLGMSTQNDEITEQKDAIPLPNVQYPSFATLPWLIQNNQNSLQYAIGGNTRGLFMAKSAVVVMEQAVAADDAAPAEPLPDTLQKQESKKEVQQSVRENFNETAFFYPSLQTTKDGKTSFKFTLPDALTTWRFMAFAHTQDWKTGFLSQEITTQKELMITPNLPRFLRQGDQIIVPVKIDNLTARIQKGSMKVEITDALSGQPINTAFGLTAVYQSKFAVNPQGNTLSTVEIKVPETVTSPISITIAAETDEFSDAERHVVPVLSKKVLVHETFPLSMQGNGTKSFHFDQFNSKFNQAGINTQNLHLTYTANPVWEAVLALPYLINYPYECAEQTFSKVYANMLAAHIVQQQPKIQSVFEQWKSTDTDNLLSKLEQNPDLKNALLTETPWVLDGQTETQQKANIAQLFNTHQLAKELKKNLDHLQKMQAANGSFSWFSGMAPDRYITQHIVLGICKLKNLNVKASNDKTLNQIYEKAMKYLDQTALDAYKKIPKNKISSDQLDALGIQYMYIKSFDQGTAGKAKSAVEHYYLSQISQFGLKHPLMLKSMMAIISHKYNERILAKKILTALEESALQDLEQGMYWKAPNKFYSWQNSPIESQALTINAFQTISPQSKHIETMKTWLVRQKQAQHWGSTTATTEAIYALLSSGENWITANPDVTLTLGNQTIDITEKGATSYFYQKISKPDHKEFNGDIKLKVSGAPSNRFPTWGAIHWQYFQPIESIEASDPNNDVSIEKKLYLLNNSSSGQELEMVTPNTKLIVGDKLVVRLHLKAERVLDYIHIKDLRASGTEPEKAISGYEWRNGLPYYESQKDLAAHFFIDKLNKGSHVIEYTILVAQKGKFSSGHASIESMYAPELKAHTSSIHLNVP